MQTSDPLSSILVPLSTDDAALLSAWAAGEKRAGAEIIRRHYKNVYLFFFGKVDPQAAQDLTQATFETLCAKKLSFRGDATVRTYLFGIARWKLVEHHRRQRAQPELFDPASDALELPQSVTSMTALLGARQEQTLFVHGMRSLALDDQIILELKYYDGLTIRELAAVYDIPRATMADRMAAARDRLCAAVERLGRSARIIESTLQGFDGHMQELRATMAALANSPAQ